MIINKTIESIDGLEENSEQVTIFFTYGTKLVQNHHQDCCEDVKVSQVDGNINRHVGAIVNEIMEKTNSGETEWGTYTETFYTLKTSKGYLDWRWQGESNGYYSEEVSMVLS